MFLLSDTEVKEQDKAKVNDTGIDYKQMLYDMTLFISGKRVREATRKHLDEVPTYFWTVPASSTGKYHPDFSLGDGGLVRHSIVCTAFIIFIAEISYFRLSKDILDNAIAACILHDSRKLGNTDKGEDHTLTEHPKLASIAVKKTLPLAASMILTHMGKWGLNVPGSINQALVSLADYLASRKAINVYFNQIQSMIEDKKSEIEAKLGKKLSK
jgi:hypothetical protein